MEEQIEQQSIFAQPTSNKLDNHKKNYSILLIEDNPTLQLVNKLLLEMLDCTVEIAANGQQAIEKYDTKYDLIFLDVGLPDISGIDVCNNLRQRKLDKHMPIIALTANGEFFKQDCLAAGVDEVFTKPVLLDEMSVILHNWLGRPVSTDIT